MKMKTLPVLVQLMEQADFQAEAFKGPIRARRSVSCHSDSY
jgi:hypothetical protein